MQHGLNNKCNQSIQHYIADIRNWNKYNDSALMVLTPLDTKETQEICAMSGFMRPSYYIRTGETNVCETYITLYIIYRTYSISLKKMIISCIGSPCLHIPCFLLLLGAGYPTLTPVEGEVRFPMLSDQLGLSQKGMHSSIFKTQKNIVTISLHVKSTRTAQAFAPVHRVLTHSFLKYVGRTKLFLSVLTLAKSDY